MSQLTHRRLRKFFPRVALLVAGLAAASGAAIAVARPTQPSANDRQITLAVAMLMERQHLTGHRLDDQISERCIKTLIKDLDPLKLFFYQSDVDEFMRNKNALDDTLKRGDITFAYDSVRYVPETC